MHWQLCPCLEYGCVPFTDIVQLNCPSENGVTLKGIDGIDQCKTTITRIKARTTAPVLKSIIHFLGSCVRSCGITMKLEWLFKSLFRLTPNKASQLRLSGSLSRESVDFPQKVPVMRKAFPRHDVILNLDFFCVNRTRRHNAGDSLLLPRCHNCRQLGVLPWRVSHGVGAQHLRMLRHLRDYHRYGHVWRHRLGNTIHSQYLEVIYTIRLLARNILNPIRHFCDLGLLLLTWFNFNLSMDE